MRKLYKVNFIRKRDNKVIKTYSSTPLNEYFWKKEIEGRLQQILNNDPDLERRDILIKEDENNK